MALPTWGMLEKNQDDPETIEQAIARLIAEHNENEESHLGPGQSLNSHKAAEIIDHLAGSIVRDKLGDFEVGREKLTLNKYYFRPSFESMDYWKQLGSATPFVFVGGIQISPNETANDFKEVYSEGQVIPVDFIWSDAVYEVVASVWTNDDYYIFFGLGDPIFHSGAQRASVGFEINTGTLYAYCHSGDAERRIEIENVDVAKLHTYRWRNIPGVKVEFYVDDVLKATMTYGTPGDVTNEVFFNFYVKTYVASWVALTILDVWYYQDK